MAHLRIANLKKNYFITRETTQEVLKGIDVEFNRGEFVAIIGESGCGKSTFLNILAGLDYDYTGSLVLKNNFMKDFNEHEMDNYRKKEVGIIFQSYNLINHMTVLDNVKMAMYMNGANETDADTRAKELLSKVGLIDHASKLPTQLSGGQKQRVAIARALSNNPTIILADEPTGNLDNEATEEILAILKEMAVRGKLVICVTHSEKVTKECNRVLRMDAGVIISDESNHTYKTAKSVKGKLEKAHNIKTKNIFIQSLKNMRQNLKRNILVSAALSIGIAAFILMFALSSGVKTFVNTEMTSSMNRLQIDVTKDATATTAFTSSDIKTLSAINGVDSVIKSSTVVMKAEFKTTTQTEYSLLLNLSSTFDGFSPTLSQGSLPKNDNEILISQSMKQYLFGSGDITDENLTSSKLDIKIDNTLQLSICGILDDTSQYYSAYISESALNSLHSSNSSPVNKVYVMASDVSYVSALVTDIEYLGFVATRQDTAVENMLGYIDIGTYVLAGISAISLVVSAIMIFIVMYISVVERTKEIGILRAIGARRTDVRKLFIFEAAMLGFVAGVVGAILTYIIGIVVNLSLASSFVTNFVSYNFLYYFLGIVISTVLSTLACLAPSSVASSADPVEALRIE